jgi:hypothetical protein
MSLNKMSRKKVLNPMASDLSINPTLFKNKKLLYDEIVRVRNLTCENTHDPVTLEGLLDIVPEFYIEWYQDSKKWGADIRSLKKMFENNHTILPWAIDYASGNYNNTDYMYRFDMKLNVKLKAQVDLFDTEITISENTTPVTDIIFDIDKLTGGELYITPTIVRLLDSPFEIVYEKIASKLFETCIYLKNSNDMITFDMFYNYCYLQYTVTGFHMKDLVDNLKLLVCILKLFTTMCSSNVLQIVQYIFMDL